MGALLLQYIAESRGSRPLHAVLYDLVLLFGLLYTPKQVVSKPNYALFRNKNISVLTIDFKRAQLVLHVGAHSSYGSSSSVKAMPSSNFHAKCFPFPVRVNLIQQLHSVAVQPQINESVLYSTYHSNSTCSRTRALITAAP